MSSFAEKLSDDFLPATERAFLRRLPEGCVGTDDPEYVERFERTYVIKALERLELLQKVVSQHVGEPIAYHCSHVNMIGNLRFPTAQHINAGIINDPELLIESQRWVAIGTQEALYSTKINGRLEQGYSARTGITPLLIDGFLGFHINGDVNENMGFMVGSRVVSHFLEAIGPEQSDFMKQNLGMM